MGPVVNCQGVGDAGPLFIFAQLRHSRACLLSEPKPTEAAGRSPINEATGNRTKTVHVAGDAGGRHLRIAFALQARLQFYYEPRPRSYGHRRMVPRMVSS